jgi:AcrR family transcriptional regulator
MPAPVPLHPETHARILDVAEGLFARGGFDGVSLRGLTEAAKVNLAAVNYHFGSKEELYRQVFLRRIRPVNARRLALLAEAEARAGAGTVPVREVFDSFLRPVFETAACTPGFLPLLARNLTAPPPFFRTLLEEQFAGLAGRYRAVLARALPHLPPDVLFWRMHFTAGAMLFSAAHHAVIEKLSGGLCRGDDWEEMLRQLTDYAEAGFGAPAPAVPVA